MIECRAELDILIRGGWVCDGTGNPIRPADVAIRGDRILDVGRFPYARAETVVDATGKIVCPGFIDAHSHTDATILENPTAQSTIRQGVTTEIVGNCGGSYDPEAFFGAGPGAASSDPCGFAPFVEHLGKVGTSCNLAWLVGHNTVRKIARVSGGDVTSEQLSAMERLVEEAMEAGALGLSTGLEFNPGRAAGTPEIKALAAVAGRYGGFYASHIRNRDAGVQRAVEEFIDIVAHTGTKGQISHLNIRYNTGAAEDAWQRAVDKMAGARARGLDILADMTPLRYGIGSASSILPEWVFEKGPAQAAALLGDPAIRAKLRTGCDRYWRFIHRGQWERVMVQSNPAFPEVNGMGFPQIAALWRKDPWDCYFDILAGAGEALREIVFVAELFTEEHLRETISHPLFMLAVDGYSTTVDGGLARRTHFPLHYMGMIQYLAYHVRQRHTLTLEEAVRKMTSMAATHFNLRDRGFIRPGGYADIVVFDFEGLGSDATIEDPCHYPRGIELVLVNGVPVVEKGEHNSKRPGRNLSRGN